MMTEAASAIGTIGAKVDKMCVLITGNGQPEVGLAFRVKTLEKAADVAGKSRSKWRDRLWGLATGILLVALAWSLAGCVPASKQAAASLTDVQAAVVSARQSVQAARAKTEQVIEAQTTAEPTKVALRPVVALLAKADGDLDDVSKAAAKAQEALSGMRDVESSWMPLVKTAGVVCGLAIVLIILWKTGAFLVVKPIMARFGKSISPGPDDVPANLLITDEPVARPPPES